jgi:hypothetical protein
LTGGCADLEQELGIKLNPEHETEETAAVFSDLHMDKTPTTLAPLFQGNWA